MVGEALPVIEARALSVKREGRALVEAVDLDVVRGELHVIIGPNGAGKSTTLAALLGQTRFTGTVKHRFAGSGVVGYVPQTFSVDRTLPMTVLDFLALTRQRRPICLGVPKAVAARCCELLDRVGLPPGGEAGFAMRTLGALSGGELRRVLIANALDPLPELLVLDEPSTGLDRKGVALMEKILRRLQGDDGATILMVSHDADQVRRIADRVSWIERTLRSTGTVAEVFGDAPTFPFARELEEDAAAEDVA